MNAEAVVTKFFGKKPKTCQFLSAGHNASTFKAIMPDDQKIIVKMSDDPVLGVEAAMLEHLKHYSQLPAPHFLGGDERTLVMTYIPDDGQKSTRTEQDAAQHLTKLHHITAPRFGFDYDTVIGSLPQPNPWHDDWTVFYREHRLLHFGRLALQSGSITKNMMARLEKFSGPPLESVLSGRNTPALIHGDVWGGNVRMYQGKISGFIDPGLYYADPEIELSFITMFNTFGSVFFDHYHSIKPIDYGFWEERKDVYLLYPLLVHCILYGSSYAGGVDRILSRFE